LDSLGIVPDLVIGTSMGSVVGGLYAMGYSGDSIASIAMSANWDHLLSGNISLSDVSVEEKSEFKRYLVDLDLRKGKPKLNSALINDQNLREFLSILTYPAYQINDFDNLAIPYRAIATDIVNGREVIIEGGSLLVAMRASMSIPSIFKPMPYENTLLVDGGILNNFPVDVAKDMGADIIIGSDVGGGMAPKENLDNLGTILFQTGMLASNLKNPENRELCDILIDHIPNLTYSTGDFAKSKEIYEEGKIATLQNMDALVAIADELKDYPKKSHELPEINPEFVLDTIIYKNISRENLDLVKARTNIKQYKKYTPKEFIKGMNRAMGTNLFNQITYAPIILDTKVGIVIDGLEKSRHQVKGSLHYDAYRGVGLILNYTGRNVIGKSSRFLATLDVAEQPHFRVQYQKNFGELKEWWWRSELYGEQLIQKVYVEGNATDNMKSRYFLYDNEINKNINSLQSYVGIGINYNYTEIKPTVDPDIDDNILSLHDYFSNNVEVYAHYLRNTLDDVFFSTKGSFLNARVGRSLINDVNLSFSDNLTADINGNTNGFTKINVAFEKRIPFQSKLTGIFGASFGFIFEDQLQSNDVSFTEFGYAAKYFLGGNILSSNKDSYIFSGLRNDELNVNQFIKLNLGLQLNPLKKVFVTPHFNIASVGFGDFSDYIKNAFSPNGEWQEIMETSLLMSAGATFSYKSPLGPLNFDVSWVNNIDKVRLTFSVGFPLNRSN
ncbi:MAG: patatin-like phospholipase family protein, partial [Eudoraea sp.]|uniref:patatin-like phospholipase family protein n=1 Tax=Eudoraea sp. TaxID=1979955 RepID=UPI003C70C5AF